LVVADRFLGELSRSASQAEASSTDPSEANRASSKVESSNVECSEASKANLKSVDSSSASRLAGGEAAFVSTCVVKPSFRLLFRDTKASILQGYQSSKAHVSIGMIGYNVGSRIGGENAFALSRDALTLDRTPLHVKSSLGLSLVIPQPCRQTSTSYRSER
jgi:hypothetical protein